MQEGPEAGNQDQQNNNPEQLPAMPVASVQIEQAPTQPASQSAPAAVPANPIAFEQAPDGGLLSPEFESYAPAEEPIIWTASEFLAHHKSSGWYLSLMGITAALVVVVYFLTKTFVSPIVIIILAVAFGMYGSRPPREIQYELDDTGLKVAERHHDFTEYRTFSIIPDGAFSSIILMPLKRFALPTTIYCAPEDEARISELLSRQLPVSDQSHDPIDQLMRWLRF